MHKHDFKLVPIRGGFGFRCECGKYLRRDPADLLRKPKHATRMEKR